MNFDEVFAGLYRLGPCTPASVLNTTPDISVLAKILTGGMVPMSVTLASRSIFDVFNRSDSKVDALLHGHSYSHTPLDVRWRWRRCGRSTSCACQSGGTRAGRMERKARQRVVWSFWSREAVERFTALENVDHAIAMGCVLKVALKDAAGGGGYTSRASVDVLRKLRFGECQTQGHPGVPVKEEGGGLPYNVHARPLGNVIYLMSSLNTPEKVLRTSEAVLYTAIKDSQ